MIVLGVIIKMLTHFPAEFCFPWSETKFSSGETQHAGEPLSPDTRLLGRRQHSRTPHVPQTFQITTGVRWLQLPRLKWGKQETPSCGEIGFEFSDLHLHHEILLPLARHDLITRLPMAQDTNRYLVLYCWPSCQVHYVNTESAPLEWLLPTTIGLLQNVHLRCLKDEWAHIWQNVNQGLLLIANGWENKKDH